MFKPAITLAVAVALMIIPAHAVDLPPSPIRLLAEPPLPMRPIVGIWDLATAPVI